MKIMWKLSFVMVVLYMSWALLAFSLVFKEYVWLVISIVNIFLYESWMVTVINEAGKKNKIIFGGVDVFLSRRIKEKLIERFKNLKED